MAWPTPQQVHVRGLQQRRFQGGDFKGYVDNPEGTRVNTLRDFATSITKSTVEERKMTSMLEDFHKTIVGDKAFPYLLNVFSKVNKRE